MESTWKLWPRRIPLFFDKTGTLTHANPVVAQVVPFGGNKELEMLRLAACLEEHFPHSMANAVVQAARERDLAHEEMHSQVEYLWPTASPVR